MFRGSMHAHRHGEPSHLEQALESDMEWFELDFKSRKDNSHGFMICYFRINVNRM
jgi:hypothetical protein